MNETTLIPKRIVASTRVCKHHRWLPLLAELLADDGSLATTTIKDRLLFFLVMCLLSDPVSGRVLVDKQGLAELFGTDQQQIETWLIDLESKRLVTIKQRGPYLVLFVQMWSDKQVPSDEISNKNGPKTGSAGSLASPPSTPPPSSALQGTALKNTCNPAEEAKQDRAEEQKQGVGVMGAGRGEEGWLEPFLSRLVQTLDCPEERSAYRTFCRNYSQEILEAALVRVTATPKARIRKSPGALFTFLVKTFSKHKP